MTNAGKLLKENKEMILILVIIIFYTVGTIGMLMPSYREQFLDLSFFNLLLSFSIVLLARKRRIQHFVLFLFLCFLTGMLAEWIGTKTGLLFGNYSYGDNLGPKISGVPLVIGINWGILVVSTASIIKRFKFNFWLSVVASALLMTFFDYLMEPVAIMSDYWSWNGEIPFYNYVCWFAVSLPLHYIYFRSDLVESNKVFDVLFLVMSVFFIILTLF
jgi:bisanhydrobacterioruberin hydratase